MSGVSDWFASNVINIIVAALLIPPAIETVRRWLQKPVFRITNHIDFIGYPERTLRIRVKNEGSITAKVCRAQILVPNVTNGYEYLAWYFVSGGGSRHSHLQVIDLLPSQHGDLHVIKTTRDSNQANLLTEEQEHPLELGSEYRISLRILADGFKEKDFTLSTKLPSWDRIEVMQIKE